MTEYVRKKGSRESIEVTAGQGTTMRVLIGSDEAPNFAFRKFVMESHGGMPKHTNLIEHEQYVLSGSGIIEIGGETLNKSRAGINRKRDSDNRELIPIILVLVIH